MTIGSDGTLDVDETTLESVAASSPTLASAVLGGQTGVATGLRGFAAQTGAGIGNMFAAMSPATQDLSTLPTRLSQFFADILVSEQLAAGTVVNLNG